MSLAKAVYFEGNKLIGIEIDDDKWEVFFTDF